MQDDNSGPDQPQALPLAEVLTALSRDFANAAASHQATMRMWQQQYQNHPLLADYQPRGMVLVSAQVSLPVAVAKVSPKQAKVPELTKERLMVLLSADIAKSRRQVIAEQLYNELSQQRRLALVSADLEPELGDIMKRLHPDLKRPFNKIALVEQQVLQQPAADSELTVIYTAAELQKLPAELIFRLNLELKLE